MKELYQLGGDIGADFDPENVTIFIQEPRLQNHEHLIFMPMQGSTTELYREILSSFFDGTYENESTVRPSGTQSLRDAQSCLDRLRNITYHIDLESNDKLMKTVVKPAIQAKWDETCSSKFRFLGCLTDLLRDADLHIGIAVRDGKPMDIIMKWLTGRKIPFTAPGSEHAHCQDEAIATGLRVTVVSSSKPSTTSKSESISLIITLDGPMDTNHPWLAETRTSKQHSGQSPIEVFHLIVPNSTEHIRLCIPETADKASSMAATTIYAHKLMLLAGKLDSEVRHRIEHPHALAEWIRQNLAETDRSTVQQSPVEWPLPLNQGIDDVYLSSESASHCSTDPEMGPATGEPPALNKRSLDFEDETPQAKRVRCTPQCDVSIPSESPTTDTVPPVTDGPTSRIVPVVKTEPLSSIIDPSVETSPLLSHSATRRHVDEFSAVKDWTEAYNNLMVMFRALRREKDQLGAANEHLLHERTIQEKQIEYQAAAFKEKAESNRRLLKQLEDNITYPTPRNESAEKLAEELCQKLRDTREELRKTQERYKNRESDIDFLRDKYFSASQTAAEQQRSIEEISAELTVLRKRADGELSHLRSLHISDYTRTVEDENTKLKVMLSNSTDLMRLKEEEIKALRGKGALGTRGSSVPRSPIARAVGLASRGSSPLQYGKQFVRQKISG